jgi:hypothetical protein
MTTPMQHAARLRSLLVLTLGVAAACSSGGGDSGFGDSGGGGTGPGSGTGTGGGGTPPGSGSGTGGGILHSGDSGGGATGDSGTTVTTIYADTDTALYTLDPATNAVTMVGEFSGFGGGSGGADSGEDDGDDGATDIAVDAEGDVYINSETALYKAVLPTGGTGTVTLTNRVAITGQGSASFYALAFAPAGVLGSGETLVGGDGNGALWAIDPSSGAAKQLGTFGPDPSDSSKILSLSGDIVFYTSSTGAATGLATIRSCDSDGSDCSKTDDYLAGIDMTALEGAYTSGTASSALLQGVYGGGTGSVGNGTGYGELFGLGAWEGKVFGFAHSTGDLVTIATSGAGSLVTSSSGTEWAGAGVTTRTTITVAPPPMAK